MIEILHYLKAPKLRELCYIPYYGSCRIYIINRRILNINHEKELQWSLWVGFKVWWGFGVFLKVEGLGCRI